MEAYCNPRLVMGNMNGTVDIPFEFVTTESVLAGADGIGRLGMALVEMGGELAAEEFIGRETRKPSKESESPLIPRLRELFIAHELGMQTSFGDDEDTSADALLSATCRGASGKTEHG